MPETPPPWTGYRCTACGLPCDSRCGSVAAYCCDQCREHNHDRATGAPTASADPPPCGHRIPPLGGWPCADCGATHAFEVRALITEDVAHDANQYTWRIEILPTSKDAWETIERSERDAFLSWDEALTEIGERLEALFDE